MKSWVISLVFISFFSFIVNAIMPNGKMNKSTNFIFSLVLITVMLQLICGFFEKFDSINFLTHNQAYTDNESFDFYDQDYYLTLAKAQLKKCGINLKKADFVFDDKNPQKNLKKIYLNYSDLVIITNTPHIDITSTVKSQLAYLFMLTDKDIIINESS